MITTNRSIRSTTPPMLHQGWKMSLSWLKLDAIVYHKPLKIAQDTNSRSIILAQPTLPVSVGCAKFLQNVWLLFRSRVSCKHVFRIY
ncbi:hypothetical protein [Chamaesiphon sp. VAR_48_metabat_135_sub]|uniref:hypothetical protein n=1 Tax=Chamaesiphon sp. VAR_48_metabat_135_sub TaxID=2964699 RepID=UPI00286A2B6A|nr:hypothetical protein [Chamaesiphon sp. VAR_48_metabat_135_sub]